MVLYIKQILVTNVTILKTEVHGLSSEHVELLAQIHGQLLKRTKQETKRSLTDIIGLLELTIKILDLWYLTLLGQEDNNVVKLHQILIHPVLIQIHLIAITEKLGMKQKFIK